MTPVRTDVCVVGGGIIGLAVGHELATRGLQVTVLEAGATGGQAAASVAAGMIAPVSEADVSHHELTRLALESHALYPEWVARLEAAAGTETGFDRTGTLWVAAQRDHIGWLEHLRAFQADRGLDVTPLTASEVREREPMLAPSVSGGLLARDDWQVDPRRLLAALARAFEHAGGTLREHAPATAIGQTSDGWSVQVAGGDGAAEVVEVEQVVVAAGARARPLLDAAVPGTGLRPVKGQVVRLRGDLIARHVLRTPDVYLVPRADGELVVGATVEEMGFDERVTAGAVHDLLREARRVLPGIAELEMAEARAGLRPALRDHLPAIGRVEDGLFVATGHFRNGVALAPVTARLLADLVCDGTAAPLLAPFDPLRFVQQEAAT